MSPDMIRAEVRIDYHTMDCAAIMVSCEHLARCFTSLVRTHTWQLSEEFSELSWHIIMSPDMICAEVRIDYHTMDCAAIMV